MKISDLSKKTGISQRMLRYFEQEGLLAPARSDSDYRKYESADETHVLEIQEWQRLGLSLKEIKRLKLDPASIEQVLEPVLDREREAFVQKERAIRDLRERILGKRSPYLPFRVAHPLPGADKVLSFMEQLGWKNAELSYVLFSTWRDDSDADFVMFGEIILRFAFYLLVSDDAQEASVLDRLMSDFCDAARSQWPGFDGCPPQEIERADLGDFFAPHDIIVCAKFEAERGKSLKIVLPYQALFALAKGEYAEASFLR